MDRTYIFGEPSGGTGANNGLLASILPSLQNRGIDTGYLMGYLATVTAMVVSLVTMAVFRTSSH